jgi:hypothetical protein
MKKISLLLVIALLLFVSVDCLAQSVSPATDSSNLSSSSATIQKNPFPSVTLSAKEEEEAKKLRERLANKVAEIAKKNNRAISGFIQEKQSNSFSLLTLDDKKIVVKLDEALSKYYQVLSNKRQEIKYDKIDKNDFVIVAGVNGDNDSITANFVYVDEVFKILSGKVTEVDTSNYQLKVVTTQKENYLLNIETKTKQYLLNSKTLELEKSGFSKIKEGDTIHFVFKFNQKDKDSFTVAPERLVIIPQEYFQK